MGKNDEWYSTSKFKRRFISKASRVCPMCACEMWHEAWGTQGIPHRVATIDHITPRSRGGRDRPNNYKVVCYSCNQIKSSKTGRGARPPISKIQGLKYGEDY